MNEAHWRVVVDDRARKDLHRLDPPARQRILTANARLAQGAELAGDIKRLTGSGEYRLRVGDWACASSATIAGSPSSSCACSLAAAPTTAEHSTAAAPCCTSSTRSPMIANYARIIGLRDHG